MRLTLPPVRRSLDRALRRSVVPAAALALGIGLLAGAPAGAATAPATAPAAAPAAAPSAAAPAAPAAVAAKPRAGNRGKNRAGTNTKAKPKPLVGLRPGSYRGRVKSGNGLTRSRITFRVTKNRSLAAVRTGIVTKCDYGYGYRGAERRFVYLKHVPVGRQGKFTGRKTKIDQNVQVRGRLKGRDLTWGYLRFADTVCGRTSPFTARRVGP